MIDRRLLWRAGGSRLCKCGRLNWWVEAGNSCIENANPFWGLWGPGGGGGGRGRASDTDGDDDHGQFDASSYVGSINFDVKGREEPMFAVTDWLFTRLFTHSLGKKERHMSTSPAAHGAVKARFYFRV